MHRPQRWICAASDILVLNIERTLDKGDDIVATVIPLGLFELRLVAQVQHYN